MSFANRMRSGRAGSIPVISMMVLLSNSVTSLGQARDDAAPADGSTFSGLVVDADGKPIDKASIALLPPLPAAAQRTTARPLSNEAIERAATGPDGRFEFSVSGDELKTLVRVNPWKALRLVASASTHGADWLEVSEKGESDLKLSLATDDVPIRGRIVSLEGEPVSGATIRVKRVHLGQPKTALSNFLQSIEDGSHDREFSEFDKHWSGPLPGSKTATTDEEGRFSIDGLGSDRLVEIVIMGDGIATGSAAVMTRKARQGETPKLDCTRCHHVMAYSDRVYGSTPVFVAPPGQVIKGTVRDKATGDLLPGIEVVGKLFEVGAVTDKNGRFELPAVVKGESYALRTVPTKRQPYFTTRLGRHKVVRDTTPGYSAIEADLQCMKGFWKDLRVVGPDGEPLRGVEGVGLQQRLAAAGEEETKETANYTLSGTHRYPYRVILTHEERKLIGFFMLHNEESKPGTVTLQPWGRIVGRIVDETGKRKNGTSRLLDVTNMPFSQPALQARRVDPAYGVFPPQTVPDRESRFVFERVVPGQKYSAGMALAPSNILFDNVVVKSGETKDLGDLMLVPKVYEDPKPNE